MAVIRAASSSFDDLEIAINQACAAFHATGERSTIVFYDDTLDVDRTYAIIPSDQPGEEFSKLRCENGGFSLPWGWIIGGVAVLGVGYFLLKR